MEAELRPAGIDGAPSPQRPAGRRPRRFLVAIFIVLLAAAVAIPVLGFGVLGSPYELFRAPPGGSGPDTYLQAESASASLVATEAGGPWNLTAVEGYVSTGGFSWPADPTPSNCTIAPNWPSLPASSVSTLLHGESAFWAFTYFDAGGGELLTLVVNGAAANSGVLPASLHCLVLPTGFTFSWIPAAGVIDSSAAVADLQPAIGSFFANHSTANGYFSLDFPSHSFGWSWELTFSACPVGPHGPLPVFPLGPLYSGSVNATSGAHAVSTPSTQSAC